ncbi:hypothetical protein KEM55_001177, partial [Ascosphaera atra]
EMIDFGFKYVSLDQVRRDSDVISLHCPATKATYHLVNRESIAKMKRGVLLVNTSRGNVIDTEALLEGLDSGQIGGAALDVYEREGEHFYRSEGQREIDDPILNKLIEHPRVLLTGHVGFCTREALNSIAEVTLSNVANFSKGNLGANIAVQKY